MKSTTDIKSPPILDSVIQIVEKTNEFDYNKMMSDFELSLRHETHLRKIRQKWANESRRYKKKIHDMKNEREEQYKQKNALLVNKIQKKDQILITALSAKRQAKSAEKQRIIQELIQKEEEAKKKVREYLFDQDMQRLRESQRTKEKSNRDYLITYLLTIVAMFESQHEMRKKEEHDKIMDKLSRKEMRFTSNFGKLLEKNQEMEKKKEEQAFKKYEAFYWHKRDMIKKQKERKTRSYNKVKEKEERLELLQQENNQKRKDIMKKLESVKAKKDLYEMRKAAEFEKAKERRQEYINKLLENKELLKADRENYREEILENQNCLIAKAINRDNVNDLKRINAHEMTIVQQMTLERSMSSFNLKLNKLKSDSVLTKSVEERFMMFKEMKRREAERKKKEEEDKQIKS